MSEFNIYTKANALSAERCAALANSFFEGKTKSSSGNPWAAILLGAPGSGKTHCLHTCILPDHEDGDVILVAYDEYGAIDRIPEYQREMAELHARNLDHETFYEAAKEVKNRWRKDAQYIRDLVLKRGIEERWNLVIDTTSSSPHSLKFDENLKKDFGYETHYAGFYAPHDVSYQRAFGRKTNPVGMDEFLKRYGVFENFPKLLEQSDGFAMYYNPSDAAEPVLVFTKSRSGVVIENSPALLQIQQDLAREFQADFFKKELGDAQRAGVAKALFLMHSKLESLGSAQPTAGPRAFIL